jgi:protein tyrosine phosphatase
MRFREENRYSDILAYDHSLVRIGYSGPARYINANAIDGASHPKFYYATQGCVS